MNGVANVAIIHNEQKGSKLECLVLKFMPPLASESEVQHLIT